jgi:peptidoglycan/LPS O-acetylase OafA/YrhL
VLSGFCLAYPTLMRLHSTGMPSFNITRFAVHRLVRILPPYYIATVALLVAAFVAYLHTGRFNTPGGAPLHLNDIVGQLLLLDRNVQLASAPYWTLIVELRWYFIFPVALLVFVRSRNGFLALIGLAYIAYFFTRVHNLDLGLLPAFLLGILAADLIVTRHPICKFALPLMFASLGVAAIIEPFITMPDNYGIEQACFFYQTNPGWHFAAFFLVLAAANISLLRSALSPRWLTFLGVASYSIYLMHYPVVIYVGTRLMTHNSPVGYIATVLAAVAVGVAFYFAAEQWFTRGPVRDRLCDWLTPYAKAIARWIDSSRPALRAVPATESDAKAD